MRELIRQGDGPLIAYTLHHHRNQQAHQQIANILIHTQTTDHPGTATTRITAYGLGDARQLRGIPTVGVKGGLGGAIPGTRPGT